MVVGMKKELAMMGLAWGMQLLRATSSSCSGGLAAGRMA